MDFYSWFFDLVTKLLADSSVPVWLADTIVTAFKAVLTEEKLCAMETEVRDLFAQELRKLEAGNPNSVLTADIVDAICVLLAAAKSE